MRINENKYLDEIEKLNDKYIYMDKLGRELCRDEEEYHIRFDGIVSNVLRENCYEKVAEMFDKAKDHFWYS